MRHLQALDKSMEDPKKNNTTLKDNSNQNGASIYLSKQNDYINRDSIQEKQVD